MPELPEVEILVRSLAPLLRGRTIRGVRVHRARTVAPKSAADLEEALVGATFREVRRRAKYLCFELKRRRDQESFVLVGHLGMTGRMPG
jgi:formamidopyrimidine-DNA glycosylase